MNFAQIIAQWIIGMLARIIAYQIDKKSINTYFDRVHTGASFEWAESLREVVGRHALRSTHSLVS